MAAQVCDLLAERSSKRQLKEQSPEQQEISFVEVAALSRLIATIPIAGIFDDTQIVLGYLPETALNRNVMRSGKKTRM